MTPPTRSAARTIPTRSRWKHSRVSRELEPTPTPSRSPMGEVKKIFLGILCGIEAAELQLKSNDVVNLPVLLTQGNKDTKEKVIFGLEKCFDCVISPPTVSA